MIFFLPRLALQKHCCYIIGTDISASATKQCKLPRHGYCKKAYILKYRFEFHNKYWMRPSISPFYGVYSLTVYNLPFNSNCRILAAELNCSFTYIFRSRAFFSDSNSDSTAVLNSDSSQNLRLRATPTPQPCSPV